MISPVYKKFVELKNSFKENLLKVDFGNLKTNLSILESDITNLTLQGFYIFDISDDLVNFEIIKKGINKGLKELKKNNPTKIRTPLISYSINLNEAQNHKILSELRLIAKYENQIDVIELHFGNSSKEYIDTLLKELNSFKLPFLFSLSLSRTRLSNAAIIQIIKKFNEDISNNLIIEIDNLFCNENKNDPNGALQLISTADIINKELRRKEIKFRRTPLIISYDRHMSISKLAAQCNVEFNGLKINYSDLENIKNYEHHKFQIFQKN
tara:strand:+ start:1868 stop:2671 length:804 start_codon:yes stop_codon:yes gene_type:complete